MKNVFMIFSMLVANLYLSCSDKSKGYFMTDTSTGSIVQISDNDVSHMKANIYSYRGTLFLADEYQEAQLSGDEIREVNLGLYLHEKIEDQPVSNVIDLDTYTEIRPYSLYKDSKNVYIFEGEGECNLCLSILSQTPETFQVLDENQEYAKDEENVYCLRNGKTITAVGDFRVAILEGITFAIDSEHVYSMCEPMSKEGFLNDFENIPLNVKESFLKS